MTPVAVNGLDLDGYVGRKWQFVSSAKPSAEKNKATLIKNLDRKMRHYRIYLPLYSSLKSIQVGVEQRAAIFRTHWIEIDFENTFDIKKLIIYDDIPIVDFVLQVEVKGGWEDLQTVTDNIENVFTGLYENISANKTRYTFDFTDPSVYFKIVRT